jgi:hypothetical protein
MQVINMSRLAIWRDSWIQVCIPMLYEKILSHELKYGRDQVKGYVESPQVDTEQVWKD